MRLLVDTHILLWTLTGSPRLPRRARDLLQDGSHEWWVSAASVWELAIKIRRSRHLLDQPLSVIEEGIRTAGFRQLPVTLRHALAIEQVECPHGDPFDRMLLAQCEVETLRLLTTDAALRDLPLALRC